MTQDLDSACIANATTELETYEEIEITPEMIYAGALALSEYTTAFDSLEDGAERIYRRMEAARLDRPKNYVSRL